MSDLSRILVVEDEAILLLDLVDQLAARGLDPIPAASGSAAARQLGAGIDALVTDIDLPGGLNGLDLARKAARQCPGLPIVVVSGGPRPRPEDLPQGARFLPKPYRLGDILAALGHPALQ